MVDVKLVFILLLFWSSTLYCTRTPKALLYSVTRCETETSLKPMTNMQEERQNTLLLYREVFFQVSYV